MIIVAPLSAHTLAKVSNGLCDDTLSCILRAWDYGYLRSSCNDSTSSSGHELKTKTKTKKQITYNNCSSNEHGHVGPSTNETTIRYYERILECTRRLCGQFL